MPYSLHLPPDLKSSGWKVKIRDRERLEPPHVTIMNRTKTWRLCLRTRCFLDVGQSWSDLPDAMEELIENSWDLLRREWDGMYPHNPVGGQELNEERRE